MKKNLLFYSLVMMLFCFACQDNSIEEEIENIAKEETTPSVKSVPIASTYFDWENVTSYKGLSLPWNTGTYSFIPESWRHPHPKSEGWELIYNTLDIPDSNVVKFLALYNKYLGVMHVFFIETGNVTGGQKYALAAAVKGNSILFNNEREEFSLTPMLNATVVKTQPLLLSDVPASEGFRANAWYGTEYHFEYQNITNRSDIYMQFIPFKSEIKDVKLNSTTTGSITGTITSNASSGSSSLIGSLGINFGSKKGSAKTNSDKEADKIAGQIEKSKKEKPKFFEGLWNKIKDETPDHAQDGIVGTVKNVITMGLNWASNPIMNFAKKAFGIGGGSTPSVSKVDLKVKTETVTQGTITSTETLGNFYVALPTTNHVSGGYGYPTDVMKDYGLGVWSLSEMPIVNLHRNHVIYTKDHAQLALPTKMLFDFKVKNVNSINIVYNPKVLQDCEIVKQSIKYSFGYDDSANNHMEIYNYGTPFRYDFRPYYELKRWGEMYWYDRNVSSSFLAMTLNIHVHVAFVLRHKTTGKLYNHVKNIKLPVEYTYETNYQELDGDTGIDFPFPDEL